MPKRSRVLLSLERSTSLHGIGQSITTTCLYIFHLKVATCSLHSHQRGRALIVLSASSNSHAMNMSNTQRRWVTKTVMCFVGHKPSAPKQWELEPSATAHDARNAIVCSIVHAKQRTVSGGELWTWAQARPEAPRLQYHRLTSLPSSHLLRSRVMYCLNPNLTTKTFPLAHVTLVCPLFNTQPTHTTSSKYNPLWMLEFRRRNLVPFYFL